MLFRNVSNTEDRLINCIPSLGSLDGASGPHAHHERCWGITPLVGAIDMIVMVLMLLIDRFTLQEFPP